jgi:4-amino-4-deoxy-L-arabinose transferase-like glycosyltransferase
MLLQELDSLPASRVDSPVRIDQRPWLVTQLRLHWPVLAVLAVFAATAFVVPTLAPVATTDDWGYSRSVEILYREGDLKVFPVVAATAVFQIVWGWLFALAFGMTLGVMRLSTVVMVGLGALALYGLLRELGVGRGRSALGVAAYLFNPLTFILAFTFMTDPHFTSLLIVSTLGYVRGLRPDRRAAQATVAGSVVAGLAFLTRQQGALIPLAVVLFLVLTGRMRPNRAGLVAFLRVVAVPVLTTVGYYVWLRYFNDVPDVQQGFFEEAKASGLGGAWRLTRNLTFIELVYLGFFALPIAAAAVPSLRRVVTTMNPAGWLVFAVWEGTLIAGLAIYGLQGRRMPYIGQFVGTGGLGPPDVLGSRPRLLDASLRDDITVVCAVAAILLALLLCRSFRELTSPDHAKAGLVLAIGLWQLAGVIPPSFHYVRRGYSLDRYLLPLLPLGICLLLWSVRDLRIVQPVAWLIVAAFAAYSIAGTRDYLVYMDTVWSLGRDANAAGIANVNLDAGSAWDGYHLYTYGLDNDITKGRTNNGPWWVYFYGKATDSTYVVTAKPAAGTRVILTRDVSTWLGDTPFKLYLVRAVPEPATPRVRRSPWGGP